MGAAEVAGSGGVAPAAGALLGVSTPTAGALRNPALLYLHGDLQLHTTTLFGPFRASEGGCQVDDSIERAVLCPVVLPGPNSVWNLLHAPTYRLY